MSLINEIREEVQEIASDRDLPEDKAFGYWFIEKYEDLSSEEAENVVSDGPWDRGRDAIYLDEENRRLKIYQFKYSEDLSYVRGGLRDLQTGIKAEETQLNAVEAVDLLMVTLASTEDLEDELRGVRKRIKNWLTRHKYSIDLRVEIIDLKRFRELSERLYGVNVALEWKPKHVMGGKTILGLLNVSGLRPVIDKEELFSFNIRRFLGLRKGSVGWKIKKTLAEERDNLWILNNGIVCLCTDFSEQDEKVKFQNFTIVNGAQTINTIAKFLEANPTVEEPIWVVAKVLKVREDEVDWAFKVTETSNTQTPTGTRDLKATDLSHRWIERELKEEFNLAYVYKRGQRASKDSVKMKDLAQAYIAFWYEEPHLAYGRPGQIFAQDEYYEEVFPHEEIERLKERGDRVHRKEFLARLLLPWKITVRTRDFVRSHTGGKTGYDKKFRSLTYDSTWLYRKLLDKKIVEEGIPSVYAKLDEILDKTLDQLFERLCDFFFSDANFPRCLKSASAVESLKSTFLPRPSIQKIRDAIEDL